MELGFCRAPINILMGLGYLSTSDRPRTKRVSKSCEHCRGDVVHRLEPKHFEAPELEETEEEVWARVQNVIKIDPTKHNPNKAFKGCNC